VRQVTFLYPQELAMMTPLQLRTLREDPLKVSFEGMDDSYVLVFDYVDFPDDPPWALTRQGQQRDVYGEVHRLPWWLLDTLPDRQRDMLCELADWDSTQVRVRADQLQRKPPIKVNRRR
jgi:hypothetical protein